MSIVKTITCPECKHPVSLEIHGETVLSSVTEWCYNCIILLSLDLRTNITTVVPSVAN